MYYCAGTGVPMLSSESAAEDLKGKRTSARLSEPSTKLSDDTSTRLSETSHPSPFKSAAVPNVITVNGQGLFDQISLPGTALSLAIEEWDHLHSHNPSTAAVQLIGLLLWTAQIRDQSVSVEDLLEEDPPAVLERIHRGLQTRGSPNYPLKGRKNFKRSFVEFWTRLSTKLLMMTTTTTFDTFLLPWLLTTSASPYRPLRHAAALACLSVISGACKACTALSGELERTSKLAKSRQGSLPKQLAQQRASAERTIQVIFEGVFVQRFRDVDAAIRLDAIEQIPTWICGLSELFLDNAYLRYLGWALSDRDGDVRLVALEGLSTIYGVPSHLSCLGTFTDRFAPRILEMARSDVDGTVRKAAAKLLCRLHDEEMIEEEDLAFLDELLVKLRLPQNPPTITLFISHILAVEAKEWRRLGDEQVLLGIHDYIERIAAGLEVVEHLVYSLVDALPALKNLKAICALADKGTSTTASLYLLEAASRAFVYPPMAGRVRVVPTRPTGLEKSIELTRIIFPTVLQLFSFTIANGAVALADLTALLDFETIFTTDGLDHLKQLCALIVGLFERPDGGEADLIRCLKFCASFGPLETYVEGCLERLRDLLVAEALELAKDLDNGTNELAKDLDNGTNALSQPNKLLHLSHLLAVVPPHMAISTSLIRLAHQCETAMLSENTASQNAFIAALTISYQVLLWNLMEYRCSSFDPTSLADQIHAVLQLSAGWRDNDHRPRLVQQKLVPIWLDLIVLFGKADASPIRVTVEPADLIGCVELIHDWIDEQSVFWLGILNKLVFYEILPEASLPLLLSLHGVLGKAEAEITLRAFDMLKGRIEASRFAPILYDALIAVLKDYFFIDQSIYLIGMEVL